MPKNQRCEKRPVGLVNSGTRERQALRRIIRLVEEWVDNGRKRHETTLLDILNTALSTVGYEDRRAS
jgi:hypothetical protein